LQTHSVRDTIHRNENQSGKLARTLERLIEKDKPQRIESSIER